MSNPQEYEYTPYPGDPIPPVTPAPKPPRTSAVAVVIAIILALVLVALLLPLLLNAHDTRPSTPNPAPVNSGMPTTNNTPEQTPAPTIIPTHAVVGTPYAQPVSDRTNPTATYTITAGALPPGLTLSSSGLISGTPTTPSTYTFTITGVSQASGPMPQDFAIVVDN